MLNIFRMQVSGIDMPNTSSNKFINYCKEMEKILWDENQCKEAFLKTTRVIDKSVHGDYDRAVAKTVALSKRIRTHVLHEQAK